MKSGSLPKGFPTSPAEWDALIAAAPGVDRPLTTEEAAAWRDAVVVREGGLPAVRSALAERRTRGQRGAQKAPRKVATAIRLSPEVTEFFKAGGRGWQTRIDEALREYVKTHSPG